MAIISIRTAAKISKVSGATTFDSHLPSSTPIRLVAINAKPEPSSTLRGAWDWAVINKVANWVLSPISAKKMVIKVEMKTLLARFGAVAVAAISGIKGLVVDSEEVGTSWFHFISFSQSARKTSRK
jgi:hypothetical protein